MRTLILHLTDFHIEDASSPKEFLRLANFDEYLESLVRSVRAMRGAREPCRTLLIATGDFVEGNHLDQLPHAARVLEHLCERLDVEPADVLLCPGNHDIDRSLENRKAEEEARKAYWDFATRFFAGQQGRILERSRQAVLYRVDEQMVALLLDSTIGAGRRLGPGSSRSGPGRLTVEASDEIVTWLKRSVSRDEVLLVGAHHPIDSYTTELTVQDVESHELGSHVDHHIWADGIKLRRRLMGLRDHGPTLWFGGDIHRGARSSNGPHFAFTTGRFGTKVGEPANIRRQAAVVEIDDDHQVRATLFEFSSAGYREEAIGGAWRRGDYEPGMPDYFDKRDRPKENGVYSAITSFAADTLPRPLKNEYGERFEFAEGDSEKSPSALGTPAIGIEVIDPALDETIRATVSRKRLYQLGRFQTPGDEVSLSWVSIGPLLNENVMLSQIIRGMDVWLERKLHELGVLASDSVIVGMDCWGAVIAGQLGVLQQMPSLPFASRGRGAHSSPNERVNVVLRQVVSNKRVIVLVTDVIASGASLRRTHEDLNAVLQGGGSNPLWVGLSILSDTAKNRRESFEFLRHLGTACGSIAMPALSAGLLPDEGVLPITLSVR